MAIKRNLEKKQMLAARATSVSRGCSSREIFSNIKEGSGLFMHPNQSQLVKTYRYSKHDASCMFWGGCRDWKRYTCKTQYLPSQDLWVVVGSVIFLRKRAMQGHARSNSKAGFYLLLVLLYCKS